MEQRRHRVGAPAGLGRPRTAPLDAAAREDIHRRVVGAAGEIIRGKGATNYAVGLASARIIEAVLYDQRQVLPVSSLLDGQAGIHDVCLSLPSVVDRLGVELVLPSPLSEGGHWPAPVGRHGQGRHQGLGL